jgi:hypothetical protein
MWDARVEAPVVEEADDMELMGACRLSTTLEDVGTIRQHYEAHDDGGNQWLDAAVIDSIIWQSIEQRSVAARLSRASDG